VSFRYKFKRSTRKSFSFSLVFTVKFWLFNFSKSNMYASPDLSCILYIGGTSLRLSIYPLYHPQRARIVLSRILCSYPFSEYAILSRCMCADPWSPTRSCGRSRGWERKGCTATVLTSVQSGTWPLAVGAAKRWGWFGSKGRACSSTFFYLRLYFSPFRRDTVFVLQWASSRRTKGEMRKCAETLTSLCWNAL